MPANLRETTEASLRGLMNCASAGTATSGCVMAMRRVFGVV